uniref:Uncharacterized protein n=1 Tax=Anguilla anguilla TaxID=7936 RepID=A0A0E9T619_ANGAN
MKERCNKLEFFCIAVAELFSSIAVA